MDNYSLLNNNNSVNSLLDNQINSQLNSQFNQQNVVQQVDHYASSTPPVQQLPVQQMPVQQPSVMPSQQVVKKPVVQAVQQPVAQESSQKKLGGQAEQLLKGVLSRSTKMVLFYIVLSVSLMCAYAWSEAMKGIVKKYLTLSNHSEVDNIIYASVITLLVVVFVQILELAGAKSVGDIALKNIGGIIQ
jgi:hypothetical protein